MKTITQLLSFILLIFVCLLFPSRQLLSQQLNEPTVLGALSDFPPQCVDVDNITICLFQSARNAYLIEHNHFNDITFYYSIPPHVKISADGTPEITAYPSILDPSKSIVQFTLEPTLVNRQKLFHQVRLSINPYVRIENLLPLPIYGLEINILDLPTAYVIIDNAIPYTDVQSISIPVPRNSAHDICTIFKNGVGINIYYRTLIKLSQLSDSSIQWKTVTQTKTFLDYFGPAGPSFVTAAQAADATKKILSELRVYNWKEIDSSQGGVTDEDHDLLVRNLMTILYSKMTDSSIESWANAQRFDVDLARMQSLIDETRRLATDSKTLSDHEWCNKYYDQIGRKIESSGSGGSSFTFGFKLLSLGTSGSSSSSKKESSDSIRSSQDCGKNLVSNNFKYEWDGVKFIPKSIFVYERNSAFGSINANHNVITYKVRQRIGKNQWSISSK